MKKLNLNLFNASDEVSKLINIFIGVSLLFLMFYFITVFVTNKPEPKTLETAEIQFDEILVGSILNKKEQTYYVLAYEFGSTDEILFDHYLEQYETVSNKLKVYKTNLKNIFNIPFVDEKSNLNVDRIKDIVFKEATVLEIKDNEIINIYEGKESIVQLFEDLTK